MDKHMVFEEELSLISDKKIQAIVEKFLDECVPEYFWEIPASSTGKYHPSFDQGEGGLVRHTKMVCAVAKDLFPLSQYEGIDHDCVIAALIMHDTFKNGPKEDDCKYTVKNHPLYAAENFLRFAESQKTDIAPDKIECIHQCILWHMGQWSGEEIDLLRPTRCSEKYRKEIELTHLSDYIASRKFFDKFN